MNEFPIAKMIALSLFATSLFFGIYLSSGVNFTLPILNRPEAHPIVFALEKYGIPLFLSSFGLVVSLFVFIRNVPHRHNR